MMVDQPLKGIAMLYRRVGKTEEKVSVLGFGAMRFPVIDKDPEQIDEKLATKMLHYAIDNGVNYVDTAFPYHGKDMFKPGKSEPFLGRTLKDGYRDKVLLATKLPSWAVESREHMDAILDGQLQRLQTDHIDFYLVHMINKQTWPKMVELGVFDFLEKAQALGKIRHIGFSYHDNPQYFTSVVDAYDWDFCQIQYNYLDVNYQAGYSGLVYASKKDIGIVVMEPLRGGSLVNNLSSDIKEVFKQGEVKMTPAQWALRWLWNDERIGVILSGMSTMEQVIENVETANVGKAGSLSEEELSVIDKVQKLLLQKKDIPCTACRYCMPCPEGVNIPECFTHYNSISLTGSGAQSGFIYRKTFAPEEKASNCISCGKCESHCPQGIEIMKELKKVADAFEPSSRS